MGADPLVVIATAANEMVARLWAEYLEDQGVRCLARSRGPGMGAIGSVVFFEHELLVARPAARRAADLLEPHADGQDLVVHDVG